MRVDLFSDDSVAKESSRLGTQVETRGFRLAAPITGVKQFLTEYPDSVSDAYVRHLQKIADAGRSYYTISASGCDSVWELECLGVGEYSKEYTVVIDLGDALDFVMHCEFNSSIDELRAIPSYEAVSRAIMNFDFKGVDSEFGVILGASQCVSMCFAMMLNEMSNSPDSMDATVDERMSRAVYKFYARILDKASSIKNYVVSALQKEYPRCMIYRSKTFSSVILSSSIALNGPLELCSSSGVRYSLDVRSYSRYEWAKEGIVHEINRTNADRR